MMSDSDDTDVLLLIPPDLFVVPTSDSDDSSDHPTYRKNNPAVFSNLIEHVQSLETRISAIEYKDSPNSSLCASRRLSLDSMMSSRQTLPRTKFSVSQNSNIQSTPSKYSQCNSLPSTPNVRQRKPHSLEMHHHNTKSSYGKHKRNTLNFNVWEKHDTPKLFSESASAQNSSPKKSSLHVGIGSHDKETHSMSPDIHTYPKPYDSVPSYDSNKLLGHITTDLKSINDMSLPEVEEMLREIETADKNMAVRNSYCNGQLYQMDTQRSPDKRIYTTESDNRDRRKSMEHKLKFNLNNQNTHESIHQSDNEQKKDCFDFTVLNDTSFSSFNTERFMSEFKPWTPSESHLELNESKISIAELRDFEENGKTTSVHQKEENQRIMQSDAQSTSAKTDLPTENKKIDVQQYLHANLLSKFAEDFTKSQTIPISTGVINQDAHLASSKSCPSIFKTPSNIPVANPVDTFVKKTETINSSVSGSNPIEQTPLNSMSNGDLQNQRPTRLLTLSDFWNHNSSRSQEDQLRIKLEEERFRREHCEELIQDLQKKLLEQQEKLAVAVRVDNEKNAFISQFQVSWKRMKQKFSEVESERENLQQILKGISEKHQSEIAAYQEQFRRYKEELSKALNLATGYKEKSDSLVKERVDLLKNHADELQNYKSLVQQAESRYEEMRSECQKLLEKNQQTDEALKSVQEDLKKELSKSSEVRNEMADIHKALDACENELTILRQEKENLQLKLREEINRNNILDQAKNSLKTALEEAKQAEKSAKNEVKSLTEQQEKSRSELRDVYQKQVDEVVRAKLQEFQTQLDSAEAVFQNEIEMKQRAIAECAARKIKSVIDKHQLEINLVEEKHKEEKKLFELKLAQATQKSAMLEAQLNSYRKSKNQLVEQLHSMMQKQWQQALLIISGGNGDTMSSFQKINVDKLFDFPNDANLELVPNHCSTLQYSEPIKLDQHTARVQNVQGQEHQNSESLLTLTSHDETPLTSRKESRNDLKKYIKMILEMQEKNEYPKPKLFNGSPPSSQKENSNKQSQKDTSNEGSSWQPISEISVHDTSEYLSVPQKFAFKTDQQKQKPPWK